MGAARVLKSGVVTGRWEAPLYHLLHPNCVDSPSALGRRQLGMKGIAGKLGKPSLKKAISEKENEVSSLARDQSQRRSGKKVWG